MKNKRMIPIGTRSLNAIERFRKKYPECVKDFDKTIDLFQCWNITVFMNIIREQEKRRS